MFQQITRHTVPVLSVSLTTVSSSRCFTNRLFSTTSKTRPVLTLYTKDNCSLCDDAKEEIFKAFPDQFIFEEVDITAPENKHWYKPYRYEIPVFHLEGQFLMKHRADIKLLGKKLEEFNSGVK